MHSHLYSGKHKPEPRGDRADRQSEYRRYHHFIGCGQVNISSNISATNAAQKVRMAIPVIVPPFMGIPDKIGFARRLGRFLPYNTPRKPATQADPSLAPH